MYFSKPRIFSLLEEDVENSCLRTIKIGRQRRKRRQREGWREKQRQKQIPASIERSMLPVGPDNFLSINVKFESRKVPCMAAAVAAAAVWRVQNS